MKKFSNARGVSFIFTILCCVRICAADYNRNVQGTVADKITGAPIPAKVFLMSADSTIIDTTTAVVEENPYQGMLSMYVFSGKVHQKGHYIIKAVMPDYADTYMDFELKSLRQTYIRVKPILMGCDYHELPEVVVKATKIKMVMRGDTIVYNADAFNLAEGSMLDALVSRLPGAQLTKDGQVFVNGKHVQSLLINGRDFFSGNPKMALENLPAYTVNKIKVYEREGDASRLMQRDMNDKSLVMDVKLKKEYDATVFGNVEAGAGTEDRFALKGFGMKSSQKEMFFAFTNINNLNDTQSADVYGQWTPQESPDGLLTTRKANVSYARFYDSNMEKWISTQNTITHDDGDSQTQRSTEIFLPSGNLFKRSQSGTDTEATVFDSQNAAHYSESGKYSIMSNLNFRYEHNDKYGQAYTSSSEAASLLNELTERSTDESDHYNVAFTNGSSFNVITDLLRTNVSVEYDKRDGSRFSLYDLRYTDADESRDFRNNCLQYFSRYWDVKGSVSYDWQWPGWSLRPEYQYNYKYDKTNNALYRLDKLEGRDSSHYDLLPSAKEALLSVMDKNNSYLYSEYQNHHRFMLEWYVNAASGANRLNVDYGYIRLPLRIVNKNLFYTRIGRHDVSEYAAFFEPEVYFRSGRTVVWELNASIKSEIPDLVKMVDYRDDSDPLFIVSGNTELKNIHRYQASLSMRHDGTGRRMWHASAGYTRTDNDIAYATLYDKRTGVATVMPVSVNGNWRTEGLVDYSLSLDSAHRWTLDNHLSLRYNHNVDMTTTGDDAESMRSVVNNWQWGGDIKLNFRPSEKYEFAIHACGTYYYIDSRRQGFENIHAGDYRVGVETEIQLPFNFSFGSDCSLYARRGYQESMMNTTEWVWNAHLHCSLLKGTLLAKITGFDLLHQLSNTKYEMNEQGRTEIWYNSLPRYVMFSLAWKFNATHRKR